MSVIDITMGGSGSGVPAGAYQGTIVGIEVVPPNPEKDYGPGFRWMWEITSGEHAGKIAPRTTGQVIKPTTNPLVGRGRGRVGRFARGRCCFAASESQPPNLPTLAADERPVKSRAIDPEEFFTEVVASQASDDDEGVPLTQELYLEILEAAGIDPTTPPPCTPDEQKALGWAKGYVLAQARRRKREQALRQEEMTPEEFQAKLWATLELEVAE